MVLPSFHVRLYVRPAGSYSGETLVLHGTPIPTVAVGRCMPDQPFDITFSEVVDRLAQLPGMYVEPDGSFAWRPGATEEQAYICGLLCDRDDRLLFIEAQGQADSRMLARLLEACHCDTTAVLFELVREGVFVDYAGLCKYFGALCNAS